MRCMYSFSLLRDCARTAGLPPAGPPHVNSAIDVAFGGVYQSYRQLHFGLAPLPCLERGKYEIPSGFSPLINQY